MCPLRAYGFLFRPGTVDTSKTGQLIIDDESDAYDDQGSLSSIWDLAPLQRHKRT